MILRTPQDVRRLKGQLSVDVPMPDDFAIVDITKRQAESLLEQATGSGCVLSAYTQTFANSDRTWTHIRVVSADAALDEAAQGK